MPEYLPKRIPLDIANGAALTQAFPMMDFVGGLIIVPTAWTAANIGFDVCDTQAGTFVPAKDKYGSLIQIAEVTTNASYAYAIPTELFSAHYVKLRSKSATAATVDSVNQEAARSLVVMLK